MGDKLDISILNAPPPLQFHNSNAQLDLLIGELREKLDKMQAQNLDQRKRIADQEASRGRLHVRAFILSYKRHDAIQKQRVALFHPLHHSTYQGNVPCNVIRTHLTWRAHLNLVSPCHRPPERSAPVCAIRSRFTSIAGICHGDVQVQRQCRSASKRVGCQRDA